MTKMELKFKDLLLNFTVKGFIEKGSAESVIKSVEKLSPHQCFDFIMIDAMQSPGSVSKKDVFHITALWYFNMLEYATTITKKSEEISPYKIMKLALVDLITLHGENSVFPHMLKLDNGINISPAEVKGALMHSENPSSKLICNNIETLWYEWGNVSSYVNDILKK